MAGNDIDLSLYPKQEMALNSEANEILYGGAAGGGKLCQEFDTVLTPFGFKLCRDLRIGDAVNNPDGTVARIIQLKPWIRLPKTTVHFHDKTFIEVVDDHLWLAWRSGKRKKKKGKSVFGGDAAEVVETRQLKEWLDYAQDQEKRGVRPNWPCIPACEEQPFNIQRRFKIGIDPYLMGQFLGDGHIASYTITSADVEFMRELLKGYTVKEHWKQNNKAVGFRISNAPKLRAGFARAKLTDKKSWNKFIPDEYKFGSLEMRYGVLQGLLDSDGCVEDGRRVTYVSVSKQLADDVAFVARSLGAVVMRRTKIPTFTDKGKKKNGRKAYVIEINHRKPWKLFRLPRKLAQAKVMTVTPLYKRVVAVEQSEELITGRCITVSHHNGLYLTNDFIVTHNSHLMRIAAIIWCYSVPGLQVYIFRRLSTDLYKNHMEGPDGFTALLKTWVQSGFVKIVQPGTIRFKNGSVIFLVHCQYEHSVEQYRGVEFHVLMIDELTHFTEGMYRFLRARVRKAGLEVPSELAHIKFPRILCGSNPGSIGHNWVKRTFVTYTGVGSKVRQTDKADGGMLRAYIPAKLEDNPRLVENDPGYMDRLEGLEDKALVKAMRDGDWDIVAGAMFESAWSSKHVILKPFLIPVDWKLNRSFDWGESKPFSVGWWAESNGEEVEVRPGVFRSFYPGSLIRVAEWYGWNGKENEGCGLTSKAIAKGILERESELEISNLVEPGPADNAINDDHDGDSIADRMAEEGVYWEKSDKRPGSRVHGWSKIRQMLEESKKSPMEGPGLFCFDTCEHFMRIIPYLPRHKTKRDDVDSESEDHVGDETRYRVWKRESSLTVVKTTGA